MDKKVRTWQCRSTVVYGVELLVPWMMKAIEIALTFIAPAASPRLIAFTHEEDLQGEGLYNRITNSIVIDLSTIFHHSCDLMDLEKHGHVLSNEFAISFAYTLCHEIRHSWQARDRAKAHLPCDDAERELDADDFAKRQWAHCYIRNNEPGPLEEIPVIDQMYRNWLSVQSEKTLFEKETLSKGLKTECSVVKLKTLCDWIRRVNPDESVQTYPVVIEDIPDTPPAPAPTPAPMPVPAAAPPVYYPEDDFGDDDGIEVAPNIPYPTIPVQPPQPIPAANNMEQLTAEMRKLFLRMHEHIHGNCANNGAGVFTNPAGIVTPISITDLPAACGVIKKFVTYDSMGEVTKAGVWQKGSLTGQLFAQNTTPGYELWLELGGQRMYRRIIAQNASKESIPGAEARNGRKITWVINSAHRGPGGFLHKIVDGIGYAIVGDDMVPWEV